jgi:hypothetical protein
LVSITGRDTAAVNERDPNVLTLDLNELSGEKVEDGQQPSKIRINTSALREL